MLHSRLLVFTLVMSFAFAPARTTSRCDCADFLQKCNIFSFGNTVLKKMDQISTGGNIAFCTLRVHNQLQYVTAGISDSTRSRMVNLLFPERPASCDAIAQAEVHFPAMFLEIDPGITKTDSRVYSSSLSEPYKTTLTQYKVTIKDADYGNRTQAKVVNDIIDQYFNYKISNLILNSYLNTGTRYMFVNQMKIDAKWKVPFDNVNTYSYRNKQYDMMTTYGLFRFAYDKRYKTRYVFLDFKCEKRCGMVLMLTNAETFNRPTPRWEMFDEVNLQEDYIDVKMPRFTIVTDYSFYNVFNELRWGFMFKREELNLLGIDDQNTPISQVVQKLYIDVNAEGVTAYAATATVPTPGTVPRNEKPKKLPEFRPYFFYIHCESLILYQGRVEDPTY